MFEFLATILLAMVIMIALMAVGVALTMPFHGALVRLRANYNPRAVGLEGTENRVGPTLTTLIGTLKRTKNLEGWYGLYKGAVPMLIFTTIVSIFSIAFVGGSSTKGPKGTYTVPPAGGWRMGLFTILLTLISLPMTVIINRSIITPYRLPYNPQSCLRILLSPAELTKPYTLYLTPGLLAVTALHAVSVTLIARFVRGILLGHPDEAGLYTDASWWQWMLFIIYQAGASLWLVPLEVVATRLSIQQNTGGYALAGVGPGVNQEEAMPEGVEYAGTDEDVIGLRPGQEPYGGLVDCVRKIIDEEGWPSLYRGWWWTCGANIFSVFAS